MLSLINFRIVGGHYARNGIYDSGFKQAILSDGTTRYYSEKANLRQELKRENIDCAVLDEWVRTGKGTTFTLI